MSPEVGRDSKEERGDGSFPSSAALLAFSIVYCPVTYPHGIVSGLSKGTSSQVSFPTPWCVCGSDGKMVDVLLSIMDGSLGPGSFTS